MKTLLIGFLLATSFMVNAQEKKGDSGTDTYTITSPKCAHHDGSWGQQQYTWNKAFTVPRGYKIVKVSHTCAPGNCHPGQNGCGHSYNRVPSKGYECDYEIQEGGTRVVWYRREDSHANDYTINVYWERN